MKKLSTEAIESAIKIDTDSVREQLTELVRGSVEETLNLLLDEEANELCGAKRYERIDGRRDTRAGRYSRKLETTSGTVDLKIPKLRHLTFESQIIQRYRRRECSVEEALVEMYLAGVSVRRVESITEALWGTKVSPGTLSNLNKKVYVKIDEWRNRPIEGEHPYLYLDGIYLKRSWGGEVRNIAVLVAIGVNSDGYREILGVAEGAREDMDSWREFLRYLKGRGLKGVRLVISDKSLGLVEALPEFYPKARWQRCIFHFYRNILSSVPRSKMNTVMSLVKTIHAQEDRKEALKKSRTIIAKLKALKLNNAAKTLEDGTRETLAYMSFPETHWRRIRTNNPLERLNKEIRRRTKVVGNFPDGQSALMLVAARLRYIANSRWGTWKYLNMDLLKELDNKEGKE